MTPESRDVVRGFVRIAVVLLVSLLVVVFAWVIS